MCVGRVSSEAIATRYGRSAGIESQWMRDFHQPGSHPASYTMGTGSFRGIKRLGRGIDLPPPLVPRLKKGCSYTSTNPLGLRDLF